MTMKQAILSAVPGAKVWLDQDEPDKTEAGMLDGVRSSQFFLLLLSRCYFSRCAQRARQSHLAHRMSCLRPAFAAGPCCSLRC